MIGQRFVEIVAEIPTMSQIETGDLDEFALRAEVLEEHDEMELEEDDRIDRGSTARGIAVGDEVTHESEVENVFEVAVEMVVRDGSLKGEQDRTGEIASLGRTEHGTPPLSRIEGTMLPPRPSIFNTLGHPYRDT